MVSSGKVLSRVTGLRASAPALVPLPGKRDRFKAVLFAVTAVSLFLSLYYYYQLRDQIIRMERDLFTASLGAGIYLCIVASFVLRIGVAMLAWQTRKNRPETERLSPPTHLR